MGQCQGRRQRVRQMVVFDPPNHCFGTVMATVLSGVAEFERELIQERIRSGMVAAKARSKRLGRQPGHRPKSDRLASSVMALMAKGRG
jgi:putative DNA-invertase from lambdoid prophage Rac